MCVHYGMGKKLIQQNKLVKLFFLKIILWRIPFCFVEKNLLLEVIIIIIKKKRQ
jgi:hypothetical protein